MVRETRNRYSLYVIELGASARHDPSYDHPRRDPRMPCLYVGVTAHDVAERYEQHRRGGRLSSRAAKKHGCRRLRPDLAGGKYALSREKGEELERKLAARLRSEGYGVAQG